MTEENYISQKPRIEFIDLAKGICILLVVQFHVCYYDGYWFSQLARNMRMPLYFVLSGMFFKDYGGFFLTALKKFNKLIVPFIFFLAMAYLLHLPPRISSGIDLYPESITDFTRWLYGCNSPLWFLLALFWINLIFFPIIVYIRNEWMRFTAVLTATLLSVPAAGAIDDLFIIVPAFVCAPFFYTGFLLRNRTDLLNASASTKKLLLASFGLIAVAVILFFITGRAEFNSKVPVSSFKEILLYPQAILLVLAVLAICKALVRLPLVSWIGRYSIILLGTHMIFLHLSTTFLNFIGKYAPIEREILFFWPLRFMMTLACCCVAIPLLRKYFPKFCAQEDLIPLPARKLKPKAAC